MLNSRFATLMLTLLLTACGGPELQRAEPKGFLPEVVDARSKVIESTRIVAGADVDYYFGEEDFSPSLMEILHTRVAMLGVTRPEPQRLEVTEIELKLTVTGGATLLDVLPPGDEQTPYRPDNGFLLIREVDPALDYPLTARIAYRVDGRFHEQQVTLSGPAAELNTTARKAYDEAVRRVVDQLRVPLNASRLERPTSSG